MRMYSESVVAGDAHIVVTATNDIEMCIDKRNGESIDLSLSYDEAAHFHEALERAIQVLEWE